MLPSLRAFCPDLVLISAGFDGGAGDIGNSKLDAQEKYHQGLDLLPADFEWATEQAEALTLALARALALAITLTLSPTPTLTLTLAFTRCASASRPRRCRLPTGQPPSYRARR